MSENRWGWEISPNNLSRCHTCGQKIPKGNWRLRVNVGSRGFIHFCDCVVIEFPPVRRDVDFRNELLSKVAKDVCKGEKNGIKKRMIRMIRL